MKSDEIKFDNFPLIVTCKATVGKIDGNIFVRDEILIINNISEYKTKYNDLRYDWDAFSLTRAIPIKLTTFHHAGSPKNIFKWYLEIISLS